jgi:hypothetical protein
MVSQTLDLCSGLMQPITQEIFIITLASKSQKKMCQMTQEV